MELGFVLTRLHRYEESDKYADRALGLAPDQVYGYGLKWGNAFFPNGDLKKSRIALEPMPEKEPVFYHGLWLRQEILERNYKDALDRLDHTNVDVFQEELRYIPKSLMRAEILSYMKQDALARASYEEARLFLEEKAKERPDDAAVHVSLGKAYAGLGRKEEAIREGKRAIELAPVSRDKMMAPNLLPRLAEIYTMVGEYDLALDQIEAVLSIPAWFSVQSFLVDPVWDPLRSLPRYKQIVAKYSKK